MTKPTPSSLLSGHRWKTPDGSLVSCREKLKILDENLLEIQQLAQEALEDAVLMGCDEKQFRTIIQALIDSLKNPYANS